MSRFSNVTVHIRDAKVRVVLGTLPHEREVPQDLLVNMTFEYDASLAAATDALGHAVDYAALHAAVLEKVVRTRFFLLERLAAFILDTIMEDNRIIAATVSVEKAGVLPDVKAVALTLAAHRESGRTMPATRCC